MVWCHMTAEPILPWPNTPPPPLPCRPTTFPHSHTLVPLPLHHHLSPVVNKLHKRLKVPPAEATPVQIPGRPVAGEHHPAAAAQQLPKQAGQQHGVGHVSHVKFIEAQQVRVGGCGARNNEDGVFRGQGTPASVLGCTGVCWGLCVGV